MSINPSQVVPRKRGRPRSPNPKTNGKTGYFDDAETRMFHAWMREYGITVDGEALRRIVLERMAADGVTDPGPDAAEGKPCMSPWSKIQPKPPVPHADQLALTA